MTSHVHLIISSKDNSPLMPIVRDMKKFTSKQLIQLIKNIPKSRRYVLNTFSYEAKRKIEVKIRFFGKKVIMLNK